jgi:protein-L-isoaspartate(D-aspartate) O-methyltransferase
LTSNGSIRSTGVRDAFDAVPRENFVPAFRRRGRTGWTTVDNSDPAGRDEWLRGVYADEALVVQIRAAPDIVDPGGAPTSSSSMPTVMAGMLEALDLRPGLRVLEIGTGTGYNAALLSHLVGDVHVTSVELDPQLADTARAALARIGLHPTVHVGDGGAEVSAPDQFDRIIATAAADHVPPAWIDQLTPGGVVVVDLRGSLAGGLARLVKKTEDAVQGPFLGLPGAFMPMRTRLASPHRDGEDWDRPLDQINPQYGVTSTDPALLGDPSLLLLIQLHFGGKLLRGFTRDPGDHTWSGRAADGSWFIVDGDLGGDGWRAVQQGGPQRLWDTVESGVATWERLGHPAVTELQITARDHPALQYVQCVRGPLTHRWSLPL